MRMRLKPIPINPVVKIANPTEDLFNLETFAFRINKAKPIKIRLNNKVL